MFDKEEEEDNEEEEENDVNDGNLVYGEVEPPGSLDDVQMFPFQGKRLWANLMPPTMVQ
jgi:hypothetical protein